MGKIFAEADKETVAFVNQILETEYPAIAGMTSQIEIGVLFVSSDKPDKPALTHSGYPAAATIRVVSEEDRAAGGPDVILSIDHDRWEELNENERYALIHHELHHLDPVKLRPSIDGGSFCDVDNLGRPKIKLRRHDFEIGGFNTIVERHKDDCIEWQSIKKVHDRFHQRLLPFYANERETA